MAYNIPIFKDEEEAGIADIVAKSKAISYNIPVFTKTLDAGTKESLRSVAKENQYDIDIDGLYCVRSILVSTVWNKNDDVFDRDETWVARHSSKDKFCNIEHNQKMIVGHITGNLAIDENGNFISDDTPAENLPNIYHIVSDSVIYARFEDEDMQKQADELIQQIEENKLFVSMECYYRNFDYAIKDESSNDIVIVERNNATAFLTKHLRFYGGSGEYKGRKIGRVLRGINFSGKGFVYNPANPDSIIFNKEQYQNISNVSHTQDIDNMFGVYSSQNSIYGENNQMSEQTNTETVENAIKVENTATVENTENAVSNTELESAKSENIRLSAEVTALKEAIASLEALVSEKDAKCSQLVAEVEQFKNEKTVSERINTLVEGGFDKEDAANKVNSFVSLSSEQFNLLASELIKAKSIVVNASKNTNTEKQEVVENVEAQVLENTDNNDNSVLDNAVAETVINPVVESSTASIRDSFVKILSNRKNSKTQKESK